MKQPARIRQANETTIPRTGRRVDDYELRIGNKATLLRARDNAAHGLVYVLTHAEIDSLYLGAGLTEYEPEAVLATIEAIRLR